jgi:predicted peptidase
MVEALKKAKGNVKFTVYSEAGHDSWTEAYNDPELYKWLLQQKRVPRKPDGQKK